MKIVSPLLERLLARITHSEELFKGTPCWLWQGSKSKAGYGTVSISKKIMYTHRVFFELLKGSIEKGLVIDHLCRNRSCCNPDHLESVTQKVNIQRGDTGIAGGSVMGARNAARTHCKYGHEFNEDNTYYTAANPKIRYCKLCRKRNYNAWKQKQSTEMNGALLSDH